MSTRAWSTATWSAPFVTQLLLALVIVFSWVLGKWFRGPGALIFLVSAVAVFFLCAVAMALLVKSTSSRARGMALSVAGSYAVVVIGGIVYGFWILRW